MGRGLAVALLQDTAGQIRGVSQGGEVSAKDTRENEREMYLCIPSKDEV